jgi:hypothetical protein
MKTLREMMDLIESAQAPVAEAYTPTAGELAQDLIGLADSDFNKKYGMSKQQANRYYSSSKLKDQGMAEGSASRTCPQCDGSGEDTLDPTKSCRRCGGKGHVPVPKEQGMAEGEDNDVEHLANAFADIYYGGAGMGMVSATEKVKLARNIVQAVEDGRLSIEQLRQDLHDVDQLQKKLGRDGRFDGQAVDEDQATAQMGLMSAVGSNDNNPADQRRAMAQQAVEQLASKR